ncbi:MAG: helix-turn-helix transcriptional regulator [Oscillospiraceae bacterium]|nr:helix-turn-helix transcriptional regulator [Oscillospiraceae bacterium]
MELHERVRYLRKDILKQTQSEFAAALGTSRDAINNIEGNRLKRPEQKEPLLKLMCEKFAVNEAWLFTGIGDPLRPVSRDEELAAFMGDVMRGESDDFRRRLLSVLARLDTDEWELLERMARKLAEDSKKEDQA